MAKRKSVWKTLLKVLLCIIGAIVLVVVGAYCYLRFALGIDIFDIKNKLDLLNKPVSESKLVTEPFNEIDGTVVLEKLYGTNDICTLEDGKITFNLEAYLDADLLQVENILTDEELASVFSLFFNNVDYTKIGLEDEYAKFFTLKQIKFSNLVLNQDITSVDINYVIELEVKDLKEEFSSESGIIAFLLNAFIPNDIYVSSTFNIEIPTNSFEDYVVVNKSFLINNLSQTQTNEVLDMFSKISSDDFKSTLPSTINTMFCDALFGGKGSAGLISSIKDLGAVEFCETADGIAIVIKKV